MRVASPVPVCYIAGVGRSGSTLLERLLGELPGWFAAGEVVHLWNRGLRDNELCACGSPFSQCRFWRRVGAEAFGGWASVNAGAMVDLAKSVDRNRYIPLMLQPALAPRYRERLSCYARCLSALYRGIVAASGCRVVIDSSKHPSLAFLLHTLPDLELKVVHVVRDSRAAAFSWTTRVRRPEAVGDEAYMAQARPGRIATRWLVHNGLLASLPSFGVHTVVVRYEDLVGNPKRSVRVVADVMGQAVGESELAFLGDTFVRLGPSHSVAGNPMRFRHGRLPLRVDDRWRREMPRRDRLLVSALTLPSLVAYGYPIQPTRRP